MKIGEQLWEGHVPVCFSIDASEITTLQVPRPYYAMVPRVSSLMTTSENVINHFKDVAPPILSGQLSRYVWFEFGGTPLKWQLPFGVLYDMYGKHSLPWAITVHFQGYPSQHLLPCDDMQAVEMHFMNSYKQAMFLLYGTTKWIMNLPQQKQAQLWEGVLRNDYSLFQSVHGAMVPSSETKRSIPLRVVLRNEPTIQMRIPPSLVTARDVLAYLLPDITLDEVRVLIHGVDVVLDVSLVDLYAHFQYPDGFLYISILTLF
ncbi:autophagy protein 5 [Aphanomyces cochlioides]|nr:autophagy protein 5 [Aphanomyces cochlioides]